VIPLGLLFLRTRITRILRQNNPRAITDFHSGNYFAYNPASGLDTALNYMHVYSYLDSLWIGEGYDYTDSADYYLVEISGIPFGLLGDMLGGSLDSDRYPRSNMLGIRHEQKFAPRGEERSPDYGNNYFRGMVYGMTARYRDSSESTPIWELWDKFGIEESTMHGWWDPDTPISVVAPEGIDVRCTAYVIPGQRTLIAMASWSKQPVQITLDIDWLKVGLDPIDAVLEAPEIDGVQSADTFSVAHPIPVDITAGWLLVLRPMKS